MERGILNMATLEDKIEMPANMEYRMAISLEKDFSSPVVIFSFGVWDGYSIEDALRSWK